MNWFSLHKTPVQIKSLHLPRHQNFIHVLTHMALIEMSTPRPFALTFKLIWYFLTNAPAVWVLILSPAGGSCCFEKSQLEAWVFKLFYEWPIPHHSIYFKQIILMVMMCLGFLSAPANICSTQPQYLACKRNLHFQSRFSLALPVLECSPNSWFVVWCTAS